MGTISLVYHPVRVDSTQGGMVFLCPLFLQRFIFKAMGHQRVGMITSYPGLIQGDWLWNQTPHSFGLWGNIQILAHDPQPDWLLLYNFNDFKPAPPKRTQPWMQWIEGRSPDPDAQVIARLRGVPKERIISLVREPPFPEKQEARKAEYRQAERFCGYVSGPDDWAPVPNYMPAIWYHSNSFRELNEMPPPGKVKPCSWITSGIDRTANHRDRLDFLKLLRESDLTFDLYGRGLPEWANGFGSISNKWHAMAPYHYNLAIENYADNEWYVSEKLWDALLAWCLPIYYGGPAADKLLPPGSFLRLPSLDEKGVAYIREVTATPGVWEDAREAIAEARQLILHKLNLVHWLSDFAAQFT